MNTSARVYIKQNICATCLSQNRKMFRFCDLKTQMKYPTSTDLALCASDDMVCWECKAHLLKMSSFRARAATAQAVLRTLVRGKDIHLLNSLSDMTLSSCPPLVIKPQQIQKTETSQNSIQEDNQSVLFEDETPLKDESEIKVEIENQDDTSMDQNIFASELDILEDFNLETDLGVKEETLCADEINSELRKRKSETKKARLESGEINEPCSSRQTRGQKTDGQQKGGREIHGLQKGGQEILGQQKGSQKTHIQQPLGQETVGQQNGAQEILGQQKGSQKTRSQQPLGQKTVGQKSRTQEILGRQIGSQKTQSQQPLGQKTVGQQSQPQETGGQEILGQQKGTQKTHSQQPLQKTVDQQSRAQETGGQEILGQQKGTQKTHSQQPLQKTVDQQSRAQETGGQEILGQHRGSQKTHSQQPLGQKTHGQETGGQHTSDQQIQGLRVDKVISDQQANDRGEKRNIDGDSSSTESDYEFAEPVEVIPASRLSVGDTYQLKFGAAVKDIFTVNTIDHEEMMELRAKRAKHQQFANCKWKCDGCLINLMHKSTFENHMLMHKGKEKYVCDICTIRFRSESTLKQHRAHHYRLYKCVLCQYSSLNMDSAMHHFTRCHEANAMTCRKCDLQFANIKDYRLHRRSAHEIRPICDMCGRNFLNKQSLERHITNAHGQRDEEECPICHRKYRGEWGVHKHIKRIHNRDTSKKDESVYCAECDKHFSGTESFKAHIKSSLAHNNSGKDFKYQCEICKKKFFSPFFLKKHTAAVHLDDFNYPCEICEEKFKTQQQRRNHVRRKHEGFVLPKNKVCEICSKAFSSTTLLRDHLNMHKGDRPYVCNICGDSFGFKAALFTHRRLKHKIPRLKDLAKEKKNKTENVNMTTSDDD